MGDSAGTVLGLLAVVVTTVGGIVVALVSRSTRQESREGNSDTLTLVTEALERVTKVEEREQDCLEALEWSHMRISVLEDLAGIEPSSRPRVLQRKKRGQLRAR